MSDVLSEAAEFRAAVERIIDDVIRGQADQYGVYFSGHDILEALHAAGLVVTEKDAE